MFRDFDEASGCLSSPAPMHRVHHDDEDRSCDQTGAEHQVSNDRGGSALKVHFGHPDRGVGRIYIGGRLLAVVQHEAEADTLVVVCEPTKVGGTAATRVGASNGLPRYRNSVRCQRVIPTVCLRRINQETKVAMLIVEQNAALALELAEHAYLLETGRMVMDAPAAVIGADESIRRSYLGY